MKTKKLIVQTPDVMSLLSITAGTARGVLNKIRKSIGKDRSHRVTIREFSDFHNLEYAEVYNEINGISHTS